MFRSPIFFVAFWGSLLLGGMVLSEVVHAGALEPAAPPAPTMKTLEQIPPTWDQGLPVAERFVRVLPTTATPAGEGVLDKNTGLVWEQSPSSTKFLWVPARLECTSRTVGDQKGWRLPSVHELASLVDPTNSGGNPDLPLGHPFSNIQSSTGYWSATTNADTPADAWSVDFATSIVGFIGKAADNIFVWCVRGGGPLSDY